ncbi:hypothetical protein [Arthrobacter psychrolactophilus]
MKLLSSMLFQPIGSHENGCLQRAFSSGNTWSIVALKLERKFNIRQFHRLTLTARATLRVVAGLVRITFGYATMSIRHQAKGYRTLARGAGMIAGAWGYEFEEYKR